MYEDSYLDTYYEDRYEIFEPTPEQEMDWAIHNDHQDDWEREEDWEDLDNVGLQFEDDPYVAEGYDDDFNDGEFW